MEVPGRAGALLPAGVRCVKPILVGSFSLPNGQTAIAVVGRRQRNDQVNNPTAHPRVPNPQEGAIELQALSRGKKIHDVRLRRFFGEPKLCRLRRRTLEEIPWRHLEHARGMLKTTGADPIRALSRISGPAGTSRREARRACSGSCRASSGACATGRPRTRRLCWTIWTSARAPFGPCAMSATVRSKSTDLRESRYKTLA